MHDDRLLGSADHAVVERLGVNDRVDRKHDIRGFVDDCGSVARADAEGGFAARVCRLDHAGAAGCEYDVRLFHDEVGQIEGRDIDPADDSFGRAGFDCRFENDLCRRYGAHFCSRVRRDDYAVTRFERDKRFEYSRGRGVGRRDDCCDDADRLGDFLDAVCLVFLDNAARFGVLVSVVNVLCGVVVLDDFVFDHAHARLFDGHFRKRYSRFVGCDSRCLEDLVDLFLSVGRENLLRLSDAGESLFELLDTIYDGIVLFHYI